MANNEPNKPEDKKTVPANETPTDEKNQPEQPLEAGNKTAAPEVTAEKSATLPDPAKVVSFDKIVSDKQAPAQSQEAEKPPQDKKEQEAPAPEKKVERGGRPQKADKADKEPKSEKADKADKEPKPEKVPKAEKAAKTPKPEKAKQAAGIGGAGGSVGSAKAAAQEKQETPPPAPIRPPEPKEAPRSNEKEQIVYLNLSELHPFKDHPFQVRKDDEMAAMVESVKDKGVTQAAIVRPRDDGGYEIVSGHRRQMASELAGFTNICLRAMYM